MYLYRATKDPFLLDIGIDTVEAIEHSARTDCGYATVSHSVICYKYCTECHFFYNKRYMPDICCLVCFISAMMMKFKL